MPVQGALAAALGHNESLEMALGQANRENAALGNESVHLRHQVGFREAQTRVFYSASLVHCEMFAFRLLLDSTLDHIKVP
jgi:hypothetical protein